MCNTGASLLNIYFILINSALTFLLFINKENIVLCDTNFPHVKIPSGDIQGVYLKSPKGKTYEAFLGIPYAKPPLGDLRFKEAQPVAPWIGVYNASSYGSDCLQFSHFGHSIFGSEDCLFINVYKPIGKPTKDGSLFDVVVHIHGGAFMFFGSKGFKPDKLMDHDIVFASINYRLGPLGFLSTGDKALPGNLGLKDQVAALKWLKDNVKYFGGDPNKITLTGVSAGGVSVQYHYLSPLSRGLFSKGISTSGAVLNPWALAENLPEKTKIIGRKLGCPISDSSILVKCLSERPAMQIVEQVPLFLGWLFNPFTPFGPTIEPEDAESPFITRHPFDIIKDGDIVQVPWLCSFTTEEGLYPAAEFVDNLQLLKELDENWNDYAPHILDYNFTVGSVEQRNQITKKIRNHYLKDKTIAEGVTEIIQMVGDRLFGAGITQSALMQASVSKAPVYLYRFGYRGKYSVSELFTHSSTNFGVCHADDAGYVYESKEIFNMHQTENDRKMSKRLINLYISFIKKGVPEFFDNKPLPTMKEALPIIKYVEITSPEKVSIETINDLGEMNFWSTVPLLEKLKLPNQFKDEL